MAQRIDHPGGPLSGTAYDITTGRRMGKVADMEAEFLAAVEAAKAQEAVYVVVGPDSPPAFNGRCAELVPVVIDPELEGSALICSGEPAEWEGLGAPNG